MKKKTAIITTLGVLSTIGGISAGTYMYMMKNRNNITKQIKKYMSYPE